MNEPQQVAGGGRRRADADGVEEGRLALFVHRRRLVEPGEALDFHPLAEKLDGALDVALAVAEVRPQAQMDPRLAVRCRGTGHAPRPQPRTMASLILATRAISFTS